MRGRVGRAAWMAAAGLIAWSAPAVAQAQRAVETLPEARLMEIRRSPDAPALGEVFDLRLTLRVRPGLTPVLPDTLVPTEAVESWGTGTWSVEPGPGDSLDVHATYPVIGYREGRVEYPWIELGFEGPDGEVSRLLRLGGVELAEFPPLADRGLGEPPRPPADVLGAAWGVWLLLAAGLVGAAGLGAAILLARGGWRRRRAILLARARQRTFRERALRELDRIQRLGWHRNGRVDEFYASSTGAVRRFASEIEPDWGRDLTSRELLERLEGRWGPASVASLGPAVETAERVKFGGHRPEPDAAEADWRAMRDWVAEARDG